MKIFLKNIPVGTHADDLVKFFTPFIQKGINPFRTKGKIINKYFADELNRECDVVAHHALVEIVPDKVAKKVLKRLRRHPFKGRRILIREFVDRCWENDRKYLKTQQKIHKREIANRRRHSLKTVTHYEINFSDQSSFARTY